MLRWFALKDLKEKILMPLLCKRLGQGSQFALKSLHLLCGRGEDMTAIFQAWF
ncbi:hypothetical protein M5U06_08350 [Avibacterium paragallinarum]|uniref:hypothetical protein n=1 Tax=Avibacterium paragallinarum TaxID=728 RepID=UPI001E4140CB|nr:hypothetical protein [Avibacterium paragallinarum]